MEKQHIIYQITNLLNNHIYIGMHSTYNVNDNYMGSSDYLKKDIKKFGKENFQKEILYVFEKIEDAVEKETELVNKEFCHRSDTYNRVRGGLSYQLFPFWNEMTMTKDLNGEVQYVYKDDPRLLSGELIPYTHSNDVKNQISQTLKGKTYEDIHGKNSSLEKEKRRSGAKRQWKDLDENVKSEICKKISESSKGIPREFKQVQCPHCLIIGGSNVMKRWHFDNCKKI